MGTKLTWEVLVSREPKFAEVLEECHKIKNERKVTWDDYETAKMSIRRLIGLDETWDAYALAIGVIIKALGL